MAGNDIEVSVTAPGGTQEVDIDITEGAGGGPAPDPAPDPNHGQVANAQVTDAVTQANVKNLGDASAMAVAHLFQTMAHSSGMMFENQVNGQQQLNAAGQAAAVTGVSEFFTVDTAAQAAAAAKLSESDMAEFLGSLKAALKAAGS